MTGSAFQVRNVVFRFLCGSKLGRSPRRGSCRDRTSIAALADFYIRSIKVSKNRSIWGSRGARLGVQSIVFGVPYGLRKWTHLGPYKIVAYLGSGPRNSDFTV